MGKMSRIMGKDIVPAEATRYCAGALKEDMILHWSYSMICQVSWQKEV